MGSSLVGLDIDGAEAVQIGLATSAVSAASVFDEAMTMARREGERFAELFATDDQRIGMTSFLENGPGKAVFVGR